MKILIDMHNHTISSGHAYSTILEIAQEASKKGMKYIGITDHGPSMQGAPNIWHIGNLRVIPESIYGVEVLKGVEANILNESGELDVPEGFLADLDIVLAGLHEGTIEPGGMESNTKAILNVMDNKYIDVIVHLGNPRFPIDMEKIVLKAKETNKLLEINNSSLLTSRVGSEDNCHELALLCKKHKVSIIVNSDSHFAMDVGKLDNAIKLLKDIDMPEELIVNSTVDRFEDYMKDKGKERFQ
jgi:putative hydrolase